MAEASTDGSLSGSVKPTAGRRQHARRRLTGKQKTSRVLVTGDTLKDKQVSCARLLDTALLMETLV